MCATCGCQGGSTSTLTNLRTRSSTEIAPLIGRGEQHEHVHADGTRHAHEHGHDHLHERHHHPHDHGHRHDDDHPSSDDDGAHPVHGSKVDIEARILAKNDMVAARNRAWLSGQEILALNLVSSPGSGKTTLLGVR